MTFQERREAVRFRLTRPIDVRPDDYRHVLTQDLSLNGISFHYPESLEPGEKIEITFRAADSDEDFKVPGAVVRCVDLPRMQGEDRYQIGVKFQNPDASISEALQKLIDAG